MTDEPHLGDDVIDYLDGALDDRRARDVSRHVEGCSACRELAQAYESARQAYRSVARDEPGPAAVEHILAASRRAVAADRLGAAKQPVRWRSLAALASAAALALVIGHSVLEGGDVCQRLRAEASTLMSEGRSEEALARYGEATRCDPDSPRVAGDHHQRGVIHVAAGRMSLALEAFEQALGYPHYAHRGDVMLATASLLAIQGDPSAARVAYQRFEDEFPERRGEVAEALEGAQQPHEAAERLRALGYVY